MTGEEAPARERVRSTYAEVAEDADDGADGASCCSPEGLYAPEQLEAIPDGAELGLGTGNPVEAASPEPGETVVDLGSGAGVDVFLAADAVGPDGRAIGVDLTPEMVERARALADEDGIGNATFLEAPMEDVPLPDGVADAVVSNCVVNLAPDKAEVLEEARRLLRPGGRLVVSDPVRVEGSAGDVVAACGCGCTDGALSPNAWRRLLDEVGFADVEVETRPPTGRFGPGVGTALVQATRPA